MRVLLDQGSNRSTNCLFVYGHMGQAWWIFNPQKP